MPEQSVQFSSHLLHVSPLAGQIDLGVRLWNIAVNSSSFIFPRVWGIFFFFLVLTPWPATMIFWVVRSMLVRF